jgi:hypothetical protein
MNEEYRPAVAASGKATAAFVLGIVGLSLSLFCWGTLGLPCSIVGFVLAKSELAEISAGKSDPTGLWRTQYGKTMSKIGIIVNSIFLGLFVAMFLLYIFIAVLVAAF